MSGFVDTLLTGATVRVELAGLPSVELDLTPSDGAPNPILAALRPRVTVLRKGQVLASAAPYGNPEQGFPFGLALLATSALVGVAAWLALR